jgi:hypothetical protein
MPHTAEAAAIKRARAFSFRLARDPRQLPGRWQPCLLLVANLIGMGLAVPMCDVWAFEGRDGLEQSRATNNRTLAEFPIWRRLTIGTYKGVNAIRDAFDAARSASATRRMKSSAGPLFPSAAARRNWTSSSSPPATSASHEGA